MVSVLGKEWIRDYGSVLGEGWYKGWYLPWGIGVTEVGVCNGGRVDKRL